MDSRFKEDVIELLILSEALDISNACESFNMDGIYKLANNFVQKIYLDKNYCS